MLDSDRSTRTFLKSAWGNLCDYPEEKPEFRPSGRQDWMPTRKRLGDSIEALVRFLKGTEPKYIDMGQVAVDDRVILFRNRSQMRCLEYLVEHKTASFSDLRDTAHVSNPSTAVKELREHEDGALAAYITTPGKSKEGYSTTILDARRPTIT